MLEGAYAEYFEKQNISMFDKLVVISIFHVDTSTGNIIIENFYDKDRIKQNLNDLTEDELFKVLSEQK